MDDPTYNAAVAAVFKRLVAAVDAVDPDIIEADATPDMVTITAVQNQSKVIVNTQRAVHQIWVAGKSAGIHFTRASDGQWFDDKNQGIELITWIRDCVTAASGIELTL